MILRIALALAFVALGVGPSSALVTEFTVSLDGAQANAGAGTGSAGSGVATVSFDDQTMMLSWDLSWEGLEGTPTVCHFHGPALTDQNAGVQVDIFGISGDTSPSAGSTMITAQQAQDLLDELWYLNLHTDVHPGGEIRGQVLQEGIVATEEASVSRVKSHFD